MAKRRNAILIVLFGFLFYSTIYAEDKFPKEDKFYNNLANDRVNQIFSQSEIETSEDNRVQFQKSIKYNDTDDFTITLDVITKEKIETVQGTGATVVLALDVSGSMLYKVDGNTTALDYAKNALSAFAKEFLKEDPNNFLGFVVYDDEGTDMLQEPFAPPDPKKSLTNDLTRYLSRVAATKSFNRQTNVQSGLKLARDILKNDQSGNPQFIVLFSDGAANITYKAGKAAPLGETVIKPYILPDGKVLDMTYKLTDFDYNTRGLNYTVNGFTTDAPKILVDNNYIPTISEGIIVKEEYGIDVYTLFLLNPSVTLNNYHQAVFAMNNIASKSQYHELNDVTDLTDLYREIEQDIIKKTSRWIVTDIMGDFISFNGFKNSPSSMPGGAVYSQRNGTLIWNLSDPSVVPEKIGENKYKYSLSYNIILNSNDLGFENGKLYPANKKTYLDYYADKDLNLGEKKQVDFTIPLIRGSSNNDKFINVFPLDMIAYQGGESVSGNSFPRPYFSLKYDNGVELTQTEIDNLTFYMDGLQHVPYEHEYFIYEYPFRSSYINMDTGEVHNDPSDKVHYDDVGFYNIKLSSMDVNGHVYYITALDKQGNVYDFRFDQKAKLEVRSQNFEEPTKFVNFILGAPEYDFVADAPAAFVKQGTSFTNSAGIPLEKLYYTSDVRLMVDTLLPSIKSNLETTLNEMEIMKDKSYESVYLNMVDYADGNIIVNFDKPVTVVYPYPQNTDKSTEFTILHFYELNRAVGAPLNYEVNVLTPTKLQNALAFEVTSFSPFIIAYNNNTETIERYTVNFDLNGGIGLEPISQYDEQVVSAGEKVAEPANPIKNKFEFDGWFANNKLWNFQDDTVNNNITLVANWKSISAGGGSNSGGNTNGENIADRNISIGSNEREREKDNNATYIIEPPVLNKYEHFAYMAGYPNGTFKSSSNMTRAEAAAIFARLMLEQMNISSSYLSTFNDVPKDAWYADEIGYLQQKGVIKDRAKEFRPNEPITRAEFAVLASGFKNMGNNYRDVFTDVPPTHWAAKEISFAVEKSWIKGYPDGSFKPERFITRGEVVTLANRVLERKPDKLFIMNNEKDIIKFKDLSDTNWVYNDVVEATNSHFYNKKEDKSEVWLSVRKQTGA